MQHRDDQPPGSSRPSLLSTEQQAEADRLREKQRAEAAANEFTPVKRSKSGWIATGAVALVLGAGAATWIATDESKEMVVIPAPQPSAVAALPVTVPAAAATASSVPAAAADSDVSVAAILNDTPPAPAKEQSLKDMLSAPAAPAKGAAKPDTDELSKLLESSGPDAPVKLAVKDAEPAKEKAKDSVKAKPAPVKLAQKAPDKSAAKPAARDAKARDARLAAARKAQPAKVAAKGDGKGDAKRAPVKSTNGKPVAKPGVDSDVTLLAALVAHTQRERRAEPRTLKQCKALASPEAEQCRTRLCAGSAKNEAECKPANVVKTATNT